MLLVLLVVVVVGWIECVMCSEVAVDSVDVDEEVRLADKETEA